MQYVKKIYKKKKREKTFVTIYCCAIFYAFGRYMETKKCTKKEIKILTMLMPV